MDVAIPATATATPVVLHQDKGLVLIDSGYYMFNRYFASLKWYRIVNPGKDIDITALHENEEFITAFQTHIMNDILRYATFPYIDKKFKIAPIPKNKKIRNKIIFCVDCPRNTIWRMSRYPGYKATRKQVSDMNMNVICLLYEFIEKQCAEPTVEGLDVAKLNVDKLEADDIVYLTLNQARIAGYLNKVLVITNDNDFLQLISLGATVVNAKGLHLQDRAEYDYMTCTTLKILLGDISDNIKAVPCIGSNTTLALQLAAMSEKNRQIWIKENSDLTSIKAYNLNKKLILLSVIPTTLAQTFTRKYAISVA